MLADTEPNPTRDRPFQYSLRTLLLIMIWLCVCFGLIKWNPVFGILFVGVGVLVIAVWKTEPHPFISARLIAVIVNGILFWPCLWVGLADISTQEDWLRGLQLLSIALVALLNIFALTVFIRTRVWLLSRIAFAANGLLACLALWYWWQDGYILLPPFSTVATFAMVLVNVSALSLGVAYWRRTNRVDVWPGDDMLKHNLHHDITRGDSFMPADTEPDPTRDRPFQYSLQTLLFFMAGLCVCFGLMAWNPIIGSMASCLMASAGLLAIAVWISRRNPLLMERLVAVIVAIAIVVDGFLLLPCFVFGFAGIDTQDHWLRGIWFLSVALVALVNIVALIAASRARVRLLSTSAFAANGYLLCLALWLWLEKGNAVLIVTLFLFFTIPLNVIALLLGVACWREANRVDV